MSVLNPALVQGCWGEVQSDREQTMWARRNVFLLVQCGAWASFLQLLHLEIELVVSSLPCFVVQIITVIYLIILDNFHSYSWQDLFHL